MNFSKMKLYVFVAVVFLLSIGAKNAAARGNWSNTIAATVFNGSMYTIEKNGALYRTDLSTGKCVKVGKAEFGDTKMLWAGPRNLFTLETSGSLYRVNPEDGSWVRIGKAGDWNNTNAGAFHGGRLFTIESGGTLYGTNPVSGEWNKVGKSEFGNTRFIFSVNDSLYTIETSGRMYAVNPETGAWIGLGKSADWANTIGVATLGNKIYTVESSGGFNVTDPVTGQWTKLGKSEFARTRYILSANGWIYTLEDDGLYRVNPSTGAWTQVDK